MTNYIRSILDQPIMGKSLNWLILFLVLLTPPRHCEWLLSLTHNEEGIYSVKVVQGLHLIKTIIVSIGVQLTWAHIRVHHLKIFNPSENIRSSPLSLTRKSIIENNSRCKLIPAIGSKLIPAIGSKEKWVSPTLVD